MQFVRFIILFMLCGPATAMPYFVQCYDFGCKSTQELHYTEENWVEIRALFTPASVDSAAEKQAIRAGYCPDGTHQW